IDSLIFSSFHTVQHYLQASTNCSNCIIRDALNNMTVLLLRCFCNLFSNCNLFEKCATDMCCSSFFNILVISSALCPYVYTCVILLSIDSSIDHCISFAYEPNSRTSPNTSTFSLKPSNALTTSIAAFVDVIEALYASFMRSASFFP